jgi:hypothetical protein
VTNREVRANAYLPAPRVGAALRNKSAVPSRSIVPSVYLSGSLSLRFSHSHSQSSFTAMQRSEKTQHDQRIKPRQSRERLTSLGKRSPIHIESDFPVAHRYSNNWKLILTEQDRPLLDSTSTLKHDSGKPRFVISANY